MRVRAVHGLLSRALTDRGFKSVEPCANLKRGTPQVDEQPEIETRIHDAGLPPRNAAEYAGLFEHATHTHGVVL